ncbi:TIGR02996 domain-containing protein [Gemmata sp.]|uniref:TIGR02996 domain-containing protein n=1 Tax=Gemmata sp. TaxID=1914242 RepID=UPI003F6EAF69
MSTDADAFVRAILSDPADVTARLAFADWLQEQGGVPNLAWAYYVRLHVEIPGCEARGELAEDLLHEATTHVPHILATVALSATELIAHLDAVLLILPSSHYRVSLGDCEISAEALERIPATSALNFVALPLAHHRCGLLVAMDPHEFDLAKLLGNLLNTPVLPVGAERTEIEASILWHYRVDPGLSEPVHIASP